MNSPFFVCNAIYSFTVHFVWLTNWVHEMYPCESYENVWFSHRSRVLLNIFHFDIGFGLMFSNVFIIAVAKWAVLFPLAHPIEKPVAAAIVQIYLGIFFSFAPFPLSSSDAFARFTENFTNFTNFIHPRNTKSFMRKSVCINCLLAVCWPSRV